MFKLLYVVIFLFILFEIEAKISDKRLCANENCMKPISHAKTILRYHTGAEGVLSFEANADVIVYSKSAGSNMELWGVEIKGVRGYVPKVYLRETRVLTKDPKFMLTTQEINQQVPSNETDTDSVIEPDKASDFTVVDGTTIYTDPDDAILPTPSSVVLPTSTVDNVVVRGDETNDNNLENDINNKETAPLGSRDSNVIDEKELADKASENKNKEQTNENNLENNTNPEETTPLESRNNNIVNEKEWDDKGVEPETKESLTGQIVQKFINLIGGDKKEKEDEDDEQDDEEFDEDSEEVEEDEDDEEYDDSEEEGYVTDDLDDKSGENDEKGDKIPIEREEPALKDENLKIEDSAEERVKLRQLLSEKDKIEKTATEESDDGTKLESDDLNSIEDKREDPSSRESSEKDVEPSGNEQNISETVTEIPLTESPGYDLPIPRYDQDYVTPNPLETDPQKIPDENAATSSENLGETTDESTEDISEETGESANVAQEIKTDEITAQHTQNLETEAVQDQPKSDDTNVNIEVQEEKIPADLPQEDIKSVESQIESETTLENEIPKAEQIGDTEALKEDNIKSVDETKKSENLEEIKEAIIEEEKSTKPEEREITLTDIAEENVETVSGILSGITNLFAGSSQNKIEEAPIKDKETKQEQNVDVEKEIRENVETNSADPQNVDQIVTHEHDLLSVLDSGKQDTSSMNEDQISQPPDVIADTPTIEYPLESVEKGYTPQDTLQEQNPQEYTPPDVLEDQSDIKDTLPKDDDLKDVEQKVLDVQEKEEYVPNLQEKENDGLPEENKVSDVQQKEEYIPVVQEKQSDDLGTFQKEDDATEATVVEAVPDVKENLGDIGDHIFDVHDQLLSKNSVEYGSCPAGESDCPTDISVVQKQLEMEEIVQAPFYGDFINLLTLLGVTGLSVALFLLGFIKIDKNRQESGLIAKINRLEKALLVASKENALLIDRVTEIQNETAAENDRISSEEYDNLNKTYQDALTAKSSLEEQIQNLEKELENSTEVGLELNRMLSDIISSQNGSEILIANVEQLQRQLVEQQGTINTINDTLNLKDTENHELQLELEIKNKKVTHLQTELDKMAMNLFKVEEDKEQMQAKLEGEIIELKDQLEKNKNGFNSTRTSMLDEINSLKAKYGEIQRNLDVKISEYNILKDNFNQIKAIKNNSEALESLLNASSMKAELQQLQRDNQTLNDVLRQEQQTKFTLEKQIEIALQEAQSYRAKYDEADKEKLEARTKLEVLSNYFKEKEAQLQKELSKHESMWVEQQGEATSTVERIKYMQEELQNCKSQNELLKQEIVAQEVELKSQISVLEKKAHESWVSARQAERRLEDAKQEAAQLRNRLTLKERSYVEDKTQNRIQSPLEQNGDVAISPLHMPVETPASPPLLYGTRDHLTTSPPLPNLPPFLPPPPGVPFMPPPIPGVPGFMPPPPSMFPVDHRPPPLGRMSSPPPPMNSRYSPDSRYSPYDRNSPSPPYDDEYGSSPPPPMPMRGYSPYNRDDRRDFKRPPPPLRTNGRNKGAMSSGSGNSNESLEKISRHHSKV